MTYIDKALRRAQSDMFTRKNGARDNVPKLLVLLTDGAQTKRVINNHNPEDPGVVAQEIRDEGIKLIVVGMGNGTKESQLINIGGTAENVFSADTFDDLIADQFIENVTKIACQLGKYLELPT